MSTFVLAGKSVATPATNTLRKEIQLPIYVGENGYIQNADFVHKPIVALEKGPMKGPVAIIMHRTASRNSSSVFTSFAHGVGTHFVVDKDGTIYQTASLLKKTQHVGKIKSRYREDGTCTAAEARSLQKMSISAIYNHEKVKPYPSRYPLNEDSVGIETVAMYDATTLKWDAPTTEQTSSIRRLVEIIKSEYGLTNSDIYEHDKISYKTAGEGADLYDIPAPVRLPPPFESFPE